jgi:hypothetical protein
LLHPTATRHNAPDTCWNGAHCRHDSYHKNVLGISLWPTSPAAFHRLGSSMTRTRSSVDLKSAPDRRDSRSRGLVQPRFESISGSAISRAGMTGDEDACRATIRWEASDNQDENGAGRGARPVRGWHRNLEATFTCTGIQLHVRLQCLTCGHARSVETLSRLAIFPASRWREIIC